MPILRVARAHARVARAIWLLMQRACALHEQPYGEGDAGDSSEPIRPILGFWGTNFCPKNGRFPALDADEPPCKI